MNESISGVERIESSQQGALVPVHADDVLAPRGPRFTRPEDPLAPIRSVLRRWRLLAVLTIIGGTLGWASAVVALESDTTPIAVDHYQARHVLVLDSNVPETQVILGVRNLNALAKRITIGEVPEAVAAGANVDFVEASTQIRVLIRSDSESLDLVTVAETPGEAELLADLFAEEFLGFLNAEAQTLFDDAVASAQGRLLDAEANISVTQQALDAARLLEDDLSIQRLQQDLQQFESARIVANATLLDTRSDGVPIVPIETLQSASGTASVISEARFSELVDRATAGQNIEVLFRDDPESGSSLGALGVVSERIPTGTVPRVAIGALLGIMAGVMISLVLNRLDNRVRSKRQVEEWLDLPVIAEVPSLVRSARSEDEVYARENPRSRFAEQYRALASTVGYARRARSARGQVVLVTSPGPAEGKTTTVANLGAMLSEAGDSILLINCDFRRPRLHVVTGAEYDPQSLSTTPIPAVELISNVVDNEDALPTEVIAAQRSIIRKAMTRYDLIIIDTAPLLATNDAVDLLDLVDDVVLVARAGKTTMQAADRASEILERRKAHVLGVVITDVDARNSTDYYYYGGYYDESGSKSNSKRFGKRSKADIDLVDEAAEDSVASSS